MLTLPPSVKIFFATTPVDCRKGFDGLVSLVQGTLAEDPMSGHLFVWINRRGNQVRLLFWDRTGYCVLAKRLERGTFRLPTAPLDGGVARHDGCGRPRADPRRDRPARGNAPPSLAIASARCVIRNRPREDRCPWVASRLNRSRRGQPCIHPLSARDGRRPEEVPADGGRGAGRGNDPRGDRAARGGS